MDRQSRNGGDRGEKRGSLVDIGHGIKSIGWMSGLERGIAAVRGAGGARALDNRQAHCCSGAADTDSGAVLTSSTFSQVPSAFMRGGRLVAIQKLSVASEEEMGVRTDTAKDR